MGNFGPNKQGYLAAGVYVPKADLVFDNQVLAIFQVTNVVTGA
jgi:hypothetical protein